MLKASKNKYEKLLLQVMKKLHPFAIHANLSKNTYKIFNNSISEFNIHEEQGNFDSFIQKIINNIQENKWREKFIAKFTRENLLEKAMHNEDVVELVFPHNDSNKEMHWIEMRAYFVTKNRNKDIQVILLFRVINDDERKKLDGITILLADDDEINLEAAKSLLEYEGANIITTTNGEEAVYVFEHSQLNSIDAIIMDIMMPKLSGIDATIKIRSMSRPDAVAIPIIALTSSTFEEDIQNSLMAGMNAHLTKPIEISSVVRTLLRCIRMQAVTQSKKLTDFMSLANKDALTGVCSRTAYEANIQVIQENIKTGISDAFGVVMFDVNNLKQTNDNIGHEAGDKLIVNACKLICNTFKHSPVFRIGGDEFVVIIQKSDYENRHLLIEDFLKKMEESKGTENEVSIASGMSIFNEETDESYEDVANRADKKMYETKALMKAAKNN